MNQTTPFVGREKEIALFKQCFEAILPENAGKPEYAHLPKVLSFYGAAGVGKTALKNKFLEIAQEEYPDYDIHIWKKLYCIEFKENKFRICGQVSDYKRNAKKFNKFEMEIETDDEDKISENYENFRYLFFNRKVLNIIEIDVDRSFEYAAYDIFMEYIISLMLHKLYVVNVCFCKQNVIYNFFKSDYYENQKLKPLNFKETKTFLNGFFDKFNDQYLRKIYDYTKGYPEQLQFLVDLVKNKQVPAENILNELIKNEGKLIDNLKESLFKNETLEEEKTELEHKVLSTATHNLNQKFGSMLAQFSTIKALIERLEGGETLPIPLEPELKTFYQILLDATQTFNTTARVLDKQKIQPVVTNMPAFFESEIVPLANGKNYTIVLNYGENLYAKIDQEAFKDAMRNLINNAEKHGFLEDRNDYQIVFILSEIAPNQLKITYQNNGRPFPKGFTFQDFKLLTGKADKKSKAKGAGIGGFWINKVIDLHKGSWTMRDTKPDDIFPIQFDIFLPKYEHHTD